MIETSSNRDLHEALGKKNKKDFPIKGADVLPSTQDGVMQDCPKPP